MAKNIDSRPGWSNLLVVGMCAAVTLALGISVYTPGGPSLDPFTQVDSSAAAVQPVVTPTPEPTISPEDVDSAMDEDAYLGDE